MLVHKIVKMLNVAVLIFLVVFVPYLHQDCYNDYDGRYRVYYSLYENIEMDISENMFTVIDSYKDLLN